MNTRFDRLILDYLSGGIESRGLAELEAALAGNEAVQVRFAELAAQEIDLRDVMLGLAQQQTVAGKRLSLASFLAPLAAAAALLLVVGLFVFNRPAEVAVTTFAQVIVTEGVGVRVQDTTEVALRVGERLAAGSVVRTKKGQELVLSYQGEATRIELGGDGELIVRDDADSGKHLHLAKGSLLASVAKQPSGQPMKFSTDHCETTVLGTVLAVKTDLKETHVDISEGLVDVKSLMGEQQVVRVAARQTLVVNAEQKASVLLGEVLLDEDFENGLDNWFVMSEDGEGITRPPTEAAKKTLSITEYTRDGKKVKCLLIDGTKALNEWLNVNYRKQFSGQDIVMEAEFMVAGGRGSGSVNVGCVTETPIEIMPVDTKTYYERSPRYSLMQWCVQKNEYEFFNDEQNRPTFLSHSIWNGVPFHKRHVKHAPGVKTPLRPRFLSKNLKIVIDRVVIRRMVKAYREE